MRRDDRRGSVILRTFDPRTGYQIGTVDITTGLKVVVLSVLLALETICLLAIAEIVYLPSPSALLIVISIVGAWFLSAAPKARDPNGAWQSRSKLSVVLVIAGIVGCLVFCCGSALVVYRSIDGCLSEKPFMEGSHITRSFNVLTGTVRCTYEGSTRTAVRHVPFGELL